MTFFWPQSWICTTRANAKLHILKQLTTRCGRLRCSVSRSHCRKFGHQGCGLLMSFFRTGSLVVFGSNDGEGDLQLVFNFYRAAAGFYGRDAVIGLHDGEFALAMKFVAICGDPQGESDGLFNSVKI